MSRPPQRWDIFCRVVDNFGDAAVCWRLARQLAVEHGAAVRLWIDRPGTLDRLQPEPCSVTVLPWREDTDFGATADVAIDAFDAGLPESYAVRLGPDALWVKLEYLSAEPWVETHHGLPSPHPTLPVRRYFFFPGFSARTGGLLRESDLLARRGAFEPAAFWRSLGLVPPTPGATLVSLFGYENAGTVDLLRAWSGGPRPVVAAVTDCPLRLAVEAFLGSDDSRGNLSVLRLPFLPQARYDELLWTCDWNFVRGEDSFVRAQWAAKPFVWQAYPQPAAAHRAKLEAFLDLYCQGQAASHRDLWRAWNGFGGSLPKAWQNAESRRPALDAHARAWSDRLAATPSLVERLAGFCENPLK